MQAFLFFTGRRFLPFSVTWRRKRGVYEFELGQCPENKRAGSPTKNPARLYHVLKKCPQQLLMVPPIVRFMQHLCPYHSIILSPLSVSEMVTLTASEGKSSSINSGHSKKHSAPL